MLKKQNLLIMFLSVVAVVFSVVCFSFFCIPEAFASTITGGGSSVTPVVQKPLEDGYFIAIVGFFAILVYEIVRVILLTKKLNALKKSGKGRTSLRSFIPYSLATLLPVGAFKVILIVEIIAVGILLIWIGRLKRKIRKLR